MMAYHRDNKSDEKEIRTYCKGAFGVEIGADDFPIIPIRVWQEIAHAFLVVTSWGMSASILFAQRLDAFVRAFSHTCQKKKRQSQTLSC